MQPGTNVPSRAGAIARTEAELPRLKERAVLERALLAAGRQVPAAFAGAQKQHQDAVERLERLRRAAAEAAEDERALAVFDRYMLLAPQCAAISAEYVAARRNLTENPAFDYKTMLNRLNASRYMPAMTPEQRVAYETFVAAQQRERDASIASDSVGNPMRELLAKCPALEDLKLHVAPEFR